MVFVCDPPRHAIYVHFGRRDTLWVGPEIRIDGETVGLFVDTLAGPSCLRGILFYRHRFHLPFRYTDQFSLHGFLVRCSTKDHTFECDLEYQPEDYEVWNAHKGVEVLIQRPAQTGTDRPTLLGFRIDMRVLRIDIDAESIEVDFGTDNLKTN